ncbi:MAG TPA: hypothetical protein DCQ31_14595 [Bacteroidales bacterium]|nr:hypothetical protein [Bacteroidales bacterium]
MKIIELTQQLTGNRIILNYDLPQEYQNQKIRIIIFPINDILPIYSISEKKEPKPEKEFWFMELKGLKSNNNTFRREDLYDEWGR